MRRNLLVSLLACVHLALAVAGIVALSDHGSWDPVVLIALLALCIGADFVQVEFKRIELYGTFVGLVVAMAVLGPAQAAVLGLIAYGLWAIRERPRVPFALMNLADHASGSLAGGVVMFLIGDALSVQPSDIGFVIPVIAGFTVAFLVNAASTLVTYRLLDGLPIGERVRSVYVPLLPSEAAMVLLCSVIVYAEAGLGPAALVLLVALFFLYLYLLRALLTSQERAEELERRTEQLASLQVGVLTAMLRTLSMRDRMTARHSAAVARYTRELSRAAGCSDEEQDLAHTAGLLHDIGKFILPDSVLKSDGKPDEEGWRLIKMHPYQGARVVREVEGYGPVADIIWAHHERIDGRGYPRGLAGDEIPLISRMISIADTYDVMTSRDSYRDPVSSDEAIAELRKVSGKQLDGRLVEVFIKLLADKGVAFRHADDADFEAELAFERRVRDHAAPRELPQAA